MTLHIFNPSILFPLLILSTSFIPVTLGCDDDLQISLDWEVKSGYSAGAHGGAHPSCGFVSSSLVQKIIVKEEGRDCRPTLL